ncbi:MAG TPA: PPC domain-containing DNA-binding protein [Longilinea sp.]|nr:PPC domain-containing DNA-binding protein [Longilinea sp.]
MPLSGLTDELTGNIHPYAFRLHPGDDLRDSLEALALQMQWEAACILTCVGSLRQATLRLANQNKYSNFQGYFEIVSLTGTLSLHGSHYHISISDSTGRTIGGHLVAGCLIYTTAEIVIGVLPGYRFTRPVDPQTTYDELLVQHKKGDSQ